jgi:XisH protein
MPARDLYHNQVKNALIQDGWVILAEDYTLEYDGDRVYVDMAAEQTVSAAKGGRMILVEVKSFLGQSFIRDLELAVGQYILYRDVLTETQQYIDLYLGISSDAYWTGFQKSLSHTKSNNRCCIPKPSSPTLLPGGEGSKIQSPSPLGRGI